MLPGSAGGRTCIPSLLLKAAHLAPAVPGQARRRRRSSSDRRGRVLEAQMDVGFMTRLLIKRLKITRMRMPSRL